MQTHDDVRHGTTTLLASLDVLEGTVLARCMQRHRHSEFVRFLNTVAAVPAGKTIHVVLDNYATHKHPEVRAWLARRRPANSVAGQASGQAKAKARQAAAAAASNTFWQIADEYRAKLAREGRAAATLEKIDWYLTFVLPALGDADVRSITAAQALEVLRTIESRGRYEPARKTRSTVGAIFRYAKATAHSENDPTAALRGALTRPTVTSRAAIVEPAAFGTLLRAIWTYDGSPEVVAGLKLLALLYPRPGELRHAEWSEFDLDGAVWTVPANRMKMRRPHRVPLSREAAEILDDLKAKRTRSTVLVFPSLRSASRRLSENTFNAALRRMGYMSDQATAHGFRASFSTIANESRLWSADAIERALAHEEEKSARRAYARGEHWDERQRMTAWWLERCQRLRTGA